MKLAATVKPSILALAAFAAFTAPAQAESSKNKSYLTGYAGYFDIIGTDDSAAQFGIEYRARDLQYGIRPTIGLNVTSDSSIYGYAGIHWDVPLVDEQLYLIPSFVAGAYSDGSGKDLGGALEFTSGIELAYQFQSQQRIGVAFNHISNASIYDKNPGSETLKLTYSVPLSGLW